jgi:hypothetical protein
MHSVAVGCKLDGNNSRPPTTCCCGRWLNTTDSVNGDHSDGTKMERWRNGNVTHSVNRPLGVLLEKHTEVVGGNTSRVTRYGVGLPHQLDDAIWLVCGTAHCIARSGASQSEHIYVNCWLCVSSGRGCVLAETRDIAPAFVKGRTWLVSWCGALTNSCTSNNGNELTKVGGVLLVVIHRCKCLFCKLGPTLSKFHAERNALAVAVIWTNGRMGSSVKDYSACTVY